MFVLFCFLFFCFVFVVLLLIFFILIGTAQVRRKILDIALALVTPRNVDEVVAVLKREITKSQETQTDSANECVACSGCVCLDHFAHSCVFHLCEGTVCCSSKLSTLSPCASLT